MPFDPENPPAKLKKLPPKKQRQWVHVFNSCWEEHKDDKKCHMMAWGAVKKSASDEGLAEFFVQNPHVMDILERSFGVVWEGDRFRALTYPDIPKSEVDRVDNAPGGLTARVAARNWSEMVQKMHKRRGEPSALPTSECIIEEMKNAIKDVEAASRCRKSQNG